MAVSVFVMMVKIRVVGAGEMAQWVMWGPDSGSQEPM